MLPAKKISDITLGIWKTFSNNDI